MASVLRWLSLGILLAVCAPAVAQPRYGLSPDAYAVFSKWMTLNCIGDEEAKWREALRRHAAELAPAFRRALADGPATEDLATLRVASDVRYRSLAAFPASQYRVEGANAQALARSSRQTFVDDQVQRYVTGYKSNAVAALGIIGQPQDRATLRRLAARPGDPLAVAATEATK